jgi:hypothetical protein
MYKRMFSNRKNEEKETDRERKRERVRQYVCVRANVKNFQ